MNIAENYINATSSWNCDSEHFLFNVCCCLFYGIQLHWLMWGRGWGGGGAMKGKICHHITAMLQKAETSGETELVQDAGLLFGKPE